jgi:hypothetical protein
MKGRNSERKEGRKKEIKWKVWHTYTYVITAVCSHSNTAIHLQRLQHSEQLQDKGQAQ